MARDRILGCLRALVLDRLCPGNARDAVVRATAAHMNPFQFLLTACVIVAVLSVVPALQVLKLWLFDVNGDGEVNAKDVAACLGRCGCCRRASSGGAANARAMRESSPPLLGFRDYMPNNKTVRSSRETTICY